MDKFELKLLSQFNDSVEVRNFDRVFFNGMSYLSKLFSLFTVLFVLCISTTAIAQENGLSKSLYVKQVRIIGNNKVPTSTLVSIIRTKTNREFLNIPNFRPWYWLWKLSPTLGEAPYPLNRETVSADIERIKTYYISQGYLDAIIDTTIIQYDKTDVEVSFIITEGKPSIVRTLAYIGLQAFNSDAEKNKFFSQSDFTKDRITDTLYTSDAHFTYEKVGKERDRILTFLKNRGFASATKDSIRFQVRRDSINKTELDVLIQVKQGKKYRFGNATIVLIGPNGESDFSQQLLIQKPEYTVDSATITIKKVPEAATDFKILYNQFIFKPGEIYNNSKYLRSVNSLQNLGIANLRRFSLSESGGLPDFSNDVLPVYIDLQSMPKHNLNFNVFGFQRFGLGAGAGLTYLNRNLFGSAEQLEIGVKGSFEYANIETTKKLLLSSEATIGYAVPGLNFPFSSLNRTQFFENSRTIYQIRASQINQFNYDIKANLGFNLKYEVNHSSNLSSVFDLFEIDLVDAEATSSFRNDVLNNINLSQLQKDLILQDFEPQVNSQIRYTIRNLSTDIIKHNRGFYFESSIELGGTLPYLADRFVFDPKHLNNTIPSLGKSNLKYDQFIKLTLDYRRYIPLNDEAVFMYRMYGGYALPFSNSTSIPLVRRFFAGGAADVRGWAPATLGPGPIQDNTTQTNGGEIKLASFVELRQEIFERFLSANWALAFFADAGNIWNGPNNPNPATRFKLSSFPNEIAVGSGVGIRLDFEYLIVRFDGAFRIHEPSGAPWFNDKSMYWFFGIGHSF